MNVHCFKTGQTVVELISKVEEATKIAFDLGVSLNELSKYISTQSDKKNGLESQIDSLNYELSALFKNSNATTSDLDEYRKNRHKLYEVKDLEDEIKE